LEEFGVRLLEQEWSDAEYRYRYEMNPSVPAALLKIIAADRDYWNTLAIHAAFDDATLEHRVTS
jgi:hypothetical protein